MSRAETIGRSVEALESRWKTIQRRIGTPDDGWPGMGTVTALERALGIVSQTRSPKAPDVPREDVATIFPAPDEESLRDYYGAPGDEGNLVVVPFPYPMRLYSRRAAYTVKGHRAHRKVAESLEAVLGELLEVFGKDGLREAGLDVFGGIFNYRRQRGGSSMSLHAWGAAIDLNPEENANRQRWAPEKVGEGGWANMPVQAVEVFEAFGWKSGGRAWGRDAMHFQATQ